MVTGPIVRSRKQLSMVGGLPRVQRTWESLGEAELLVAWKKTKARPRCSGAGETGHWTEAAPSRMPHVPRRAMGTVVSCCVPGDSDAAEAVSVAAPGE